ncbi:MAG: OmpA family protein [Deltaproteobacteria bacterium]|nr:MAG: OmpA family protein [Deltaproteobacteria bacterium]
MPIGLSAHLREGDAAPGSRATGGRGARGCRARAGQPVTAVVYFDVGSSVIGDDGQRELRWFIQRIQPYPQAVILVQGFADSTGAEAKNRTLSEDRAKAVAGFLGAQGISSSRIVTQGYGTESPAAANATVQGRSRNRRVEVTVQ